MKAARQFLILLMVSALAVPGAWSQTDSFTKHFKHYNNIVIGIDFYAGSQSQLVPFEKPAREARQRLETLLGKDLTKGAIVICSTLEQMDAQNDRRILKAGYKWVITQLTSEAMAQQMLTQLKAQSGGQLPPGLPERPQDRTSEMKAAGDFLMINSMMQRVAFAIVSTTLSPDKEFRASRLDDMGRSPLPDWLDIGMTAYAAGSGSINYRFLQEHLEEVFPLEDLLSMARPFVAPTDASAGGGEQMTVRIAGQGQASGDAPTQFSGAPQQSGTRGDGGNSAMGAMRMGAPMAKDLQDRMTFDAQAASFFSYVIQKIGIEKAREIVQSSLQGKLSREAIARPGYLGTDLDEVERDWQTWVKEQRVEPPPGLRLNAGPQRPRGSSQ
jgi:hypothetical protein